MRPDYGTVFQIRSKGTLPANYRVGTRGAPKSGHTAQLRTAQGKPLPLFSAQLCARDATTFLLTQCRPDFSSRKAYSALEDQLPIR